MGSKTDKLASMFESAKETTKKVVKSTGKKTSDMFGKSKDKDQF